MLRVCGGSICRIIKNGNRQEARRDVVRRLGSKGFQLIDGKDESGNAMEMRNSGRTKEAAPRKRTATERVAEDIFLFRNGGSLRAEYDKKVRVPNKSGSGNI